jgi:hypothetical protein
MSCLPDPANEKGARPPRRPGESGPGRQGSLKILPAGAGVGAAPAGSQTSHRRRESPVIRVTGRHHEHEGHHRYCGSSARQVGSRPESGVSAT